MRTGLTQNPAVMSSDTGDGGEGCERKEGDTEMDKALGFYFIIFVSFFVLYLCNVYIYYRMVGLY